MRFFFDGSFPKRLCLAIRVLEHGNSDVEIVFKHEKFAPDTDDIDWIGGLASDGHDWVIITMDPEILRKPHERAAWDEAGLTGFFLDGTWGNLRIDETAWRFLRWWPVVKSTAATMQPGSTFVVPSQHGRRLLPIGGVLSQRRSRP